MDDKFEIRVQTGRLGFKQEFEKRDEPQLTKIFEFCRKQHFIEISEHIRDEDFFK